MVSGMVMTTGMARHSYGYEYGYDNGHGGCQAGRSALLALQDSNPADFY